MIFESNLERESISIINIIINESNTPKHTLKQKQAKKILCVKTCYFYYTDTTANILQKAGANLT